MSILRCSSYSINALSRMVRGCAVQSDPDDNADSPQDFDFCLNNHDVWAWCRRVQRKRLLSSRIEALQSKPSLGHRAWVPELRLLRLQQVGVPYLLWRIDDQGVRL